MEKEEMKKNKKISKWRPQMEKSITITGHRDAMEQFSVRIPPDEGKILKRTAKANKSTCAAILRTAWTEFIAGHDL
jgi:hypothetical protein